MREWIKIVARALLIAIILALMILYTTFLLNSGGSVAYAESKPNTVYTYCLGERYGAEWAINGYTAHGVSVDWEQFDAPDLPMFKACSSDEILSVLNSVRGIK